MKSEVLKFMRTQKFCVISTVTDENKPEAALVGFSETDNLELIVGMHKQTRKYQNLKTNPDVAVFIGLGPERITVQYEGEAEELSIDEANKIKDKHIAKIPGSAKFFNREGQTWIKISPKWLRYNDSPDEHREVKELRFS